MASSWSIAAPPSHPTPSLLPTSFWSPEGEVETSPAHSGLPFTALISWAGILCARRRAVVLLPLCLVLGKVSRCVLAFRSGSWIVRSRSSSSWWGRELSSVLPATHVVTVSIFHFKSKQMDWVFFVFNLLGNLQVVTWDWPSGLQSRLQFWGLPIRT